MMKSNKHSSVFQVALICCKCVPNSLHERHLLLLVGYKSILCILSRRKYIVGPSTNAFFSFLGEKYVVGRVQIHLLHFQQKRNTLLVQEQIHLLYFQERNTLLVGYKWSGCFPVSLARGGLTAVGRPIHWL